MRRVQVAVIQIAGSWRLFMDGERPGAFREQGSAVACATGIARSTQDEGFDVDLLVHDVSGELMRVPITPEPPRP